MTWRIFGQWKHREAEDRTAATASVGLLELRIKYPRKEPLQKNLPGHPL